MWPYSIALQLLHISQSESENLECSQARGRKILMKPLCGNICRTRIRLHHVGGGTTVCGDLEHRSLSLSYSRQVRHTHRYGPSFHHGGYALERQLAKSGPPISGHSRLTTVHVSMCQIQREVFYCVRGCAVNRAGATHIDEIHSVSVIQLLMSS